MSPKKKKKGGGGNKKKTKKSCIPDLLPPRVLPPGVEFKTHSYEDLTPQSRVSTFHNAALRSDLDLVRQYLANGFDIEAATSDGRTALMAAAWRGKLDVVRALLRMKASLRAKDDYGRTALMLAACSGQLQTIRLLLSHGADPMEADLVGESALLKARSHGHKSISVLLSDSAIWRPYAQRGTMQLPLPAWQSATSPRAKLGLGTHALSGVKLRMGSPPSRIPRGFITSSPACTNAAFKDSDTSLSNQTTSSATSQVGIELAKSSVVQGTKQDEHASKKNTSDSAWMLPE